MLTRCPECASWFRVRAEHLSAAKGLVTCGDCESVFNALVSLVEEGRPGSVAAPPRPEVPNKPPSSDLEADGAQPDSGPAPADAQASPATVPNVEAIEAVEESPPELLRNELSALERDRERVPRRTGVWGLLCIILAFVLVAQLAYHFRDQVGTRWPRTAPLLAAMCAHFGCPAGPAANTRGVELLARDVREHPQYHDALLVNATLVNKGASARPFPMLELVLHDASGEIVGARRFAPEQYLDHSIAIAAGMTPNQPVHIVMELGGQTATATSFEFSFM